MAQGADHSMPRHPGMPSSAIATGLVDLVLPVEEMPERLLDYVHRFGDGRALVDASGPAQRASSGSPGRVAPSAPSCAIRSVTTSPATRSNTLLRRVLRRMQVLQLTDIDSYVELLNTDPDEVMMLFRDLLIGVTSFFRDADAFETPGADRHPAAVRGQGRQRHGAGLGARLRHRRGGLLAGHPAARAHAHAAGAPKVQVFATDIDDAALEVARAGRYPAALLDDVSQERLERFFIGDGTSYVVAKDVRDLCIFSSHSVIRDPPFSRIDLVSCRNLLIYLNAELQERVIPIFHYALRPGGFLFLGISENVSQHGDLFLPLDKKQRIFQRRDHVRAPIHCPAGRPRAEPRGRSRPRCGDARLQRAEPAAVGRTAGSRALRPGARRRQPRRRGRLLLGADRQVPRGRRRRAEPPHPHAWHARACGSICAALSRKRGRSGRSSARDRIAIEIDDRVQVVDLMIEPLPEQDSDPLFLVLFTDVGPMLSLDEAAARGARYRMSTAPSRSSSANCARRANGCSRSSRSTRRRWRS